MASLKVSSNFTRNLLFIVSFLLSIVTSQDFLAPQATVTPYSPKGLRISIQNEYGIKWVSYHIKINSEFEGLEIGELTRDIVKPNDGEWVYEDKTSELKVGDIIYYWINIVHNGEEYILEDQQYRVKELYPRETSPKDGIINVGSRDQISCPSTYSVTKLIDDSGELSSDTCSGQLLFQENFDNLDETKWTVHEHFAVGPDYEFVIYNKNNVKIDNGNLKITPELLKEKYGVEKIRQGTLTLRNCTLIQDTKDCRRKAQGFDVIPPVLSGKLTTEKSFRFLYGRVEIRAKFPKGDWIYPLLSLEPFKSHLPEEQRVSMRVGLSPGNPSLNSTEGNDLSGHVLRGGYVTQTYGRTEVSYFPPGVATLQDNHYWSDDFHVYEIIWQQEQMILKVDGNAYTSTTDVSRLSLVNEPVFLNLAVAVGGHREFANEATSNGFKKPWCNNCAKALFNFFNASDVWSNNWHEKTKDLIVDYVKVYAI